MLPVARIVVHPSQFPDQVRRDLFESLRRRQVNHKFHYDSVRQTQKWLALHQACSPSRRDADCAAIYDRSFAAVSTSIKDQTVHVIGLGCGGGRKDTQLLKRLKNAGRKISYIPCDVSTAMVLVARQTALSIVREPDCLPFVCDLATANDLSPVFGRLSAPGTTRLLTFFGMIPNFEPDLILPRLAALVRRRDQLLFSANLAPGNDYAAGMTRILPQYDNSFTRDWLITFLLDLGIGKHDGRLIFRIEDVRRNRLKRVLVNFQFKRSCKIQIEERTFKFKAGEVLRLFFSYRYTPEKVRETLIRHGLVVQRQWLAKSEEEGVFLCGRI